MPRSDPRFGSNNIDDLRVVLPPKDEVYLTIEGTIQHFKIIMEGLKLPAEEVYSGIERLLQGQKLADC